MIRYTEKLLKYSEGLCYEDFCANEMLVEACVFNLSQMGELAHNLDAEFIGIHREIPWISLYGLRNRIVHDYEGVKLNMIWDVLSSDLQRI